MGDFLANSRTLAKLDLIKFARQVLTEVENVRSYKLTFDSENRLTSQKPLESRVNAFFRLVGLPMFVAIEPLSKEKKTAKNKRGAEILSPGYQEGEQIPLTLYRVRNSKDVMLSNPADIGKEGPVQQLPVNTLVDTQREQVLRARENSIGTETFNKAMVRAMYRVDVPQFHMRRDLTDIGYKYTKVLAPFVTSYVNVQPANRELAKPFVPDPKDYTIGENILRKPFLETVIRIRLGTSRGANQVQTDYMAGLRTELDDISKQAFGSDDRAAADAIPQLLPKEANVLESFIISQMMAAIGQIAQRWVLLQKQREKILKAAEISLAPVTESAKQSMFGRQANTAIALSITPDSELGRRKVKLQQRVAVSEALIGLIPTEDAVGTKTSAQFVSTKNVMSNALTISFLSLLRQNLDLERSKLRDVERKIQEESRKANQLRLEIEALTGEFSGLSVVDVMFTILALFLIDRKYLVALLDGDSFGLMLQDDTLFMAAAEAGNATTQDAVEEVAAKVKTLYDLLQAAIIETYDKSKRSNINSDAKTSQQKNRTASASKRAAVLSSGG